MDNQAIAQRLATTPSIVEDAFAFLVHYGYLPEGVDTREFVADPVRDTEAFQQAILNFQAFAGIAQTGVPDKTTLAKMTAPRCGVKDVGAQRELNARWRKTSLNYLVRGYVNNLSRADQDDLLGIAFKDWSDATNGLLKFTRVSTQVGADIVIDVGQGPADNFDGPSGTLAWAYLPNGNDGQLLMKFDLSETWVKSGNGIHFRNVACHEFGHLLGLEHSRVQGALMYPYYSPQIVTPQANDDVSRIRNLYGVGNNPAPTPTPTPKPACPSAEFVLSLVKTYNRIRHSGGNMNDLNEVAEKASIPCAEIKGAIGKLCPTAQAFLDGGAGICKLIAVLSEYLPKLCPTEQK